MARQPFYHSADQLLFTATRDVPHDELLAALRAALAGVRGVLIDTIEIAGDYGSDAGDPSALMEDEE